MLSNVLAWTISSLYQLGRLYDPLVLGEWGRGRWSHVCTSSRQRTTSKSTYQELYVMSHISIIIGACFIPQGIVRVIERSFIKTWKHFSCFVDVWGFAKYLSKSRLHKYFMTFFLIVNYRQHACHKDKGFDRKYLQSNTLEVYYLFHLSICWLQICLQTCLEGINASLIVWEFTLSCWYRLINDMLVETEIVFFVSCIVKE